MNARKLFLSIILIPILFFSGTAQAGDLALVRFQKANEQELQKTEISDNGKQRTFRNMLQKGDSEKDIRGLFVQPEISITESKLNPSLTFSASKAYFPIIFGVTQTLGVTFEFTANYSLETDEPNEMHKDFLFQGGDMDFNLNLNWAPGDWAFQVAYDYSLLSADELSVDTTVNEIDAEIQSLNVSVMYDFSGVLAKVEYRDFDLMSEANENEFAKLIDEEESLIIGLLMPLTFEDKSYLFKFERARSSKLDEGLFRIGFETSF